MPDENKSYCPNCQRVLVGVLEIIKTTTLGMPSILYRESSDRNWIQCDGCNLIICKNCCEKYRNGFCNDCWRQLVETGIRKTAKLIVLHRPEISAAQNQMILEFESNSKGGLLKIKINLQIKLKTK